MAYLPNTLIETQTVSLVTAVTFVTGITADRYNYLLKSTSVNNPAATGNGILLQLSTDGGMTYISTNYSNSALGATAGLIMGVQGTGSATMFGYYETNIFNLTSGIGFITVDGTISNFDSINGPFSDSEVSNAYTISPTVANAFQLVMDDGSAFSGTFSLYSYSQ